MLKYLLILGCILFAGCAHIKQANQEADQEQIKREAVTRTDDSGVVWFRSASLNRFTQSPLPGHPHDRHKFDVEVQIRYGEIFIDGDEVESLEIPYSSIKKIDVSATKEDFKAIDVVASGFLGAWVAQEASEEAWVILQTDEGPIYLAFSPQTQKVFKYALNRRMTAPEQFRDGMK